MILVILLVIIVIGIFLFKRNGRVSKSIFFYIIMGELIIGLIGLLLGIFGAVIFSPGNNLAPIIGFLITGPIGFIIGLIAGGNYWKVKIKGKAEKKVVL